MIEREGGGGGVREGERGERKRGDRAGGERKSGGEGERGR